MKQGTVRANVAMLVKKKGAVHVKRNLCLALFLFR
jgi:hypothetical protein